MSDRFRKSSCAGSSARRLFLRWATAVALVLTANAGQGARAAEGGPGSSGGGPKNDAVRLRGEPVKAARHKTGATAATQSPEGRITRRHHAGAASGDARSDRGALREHHPDGSLPGHPVHEKGRVKGGHKKSEATEAHLKHARPNAGLAPRGGVHKKR